MQRVPSLLRALVGTCVVAGLVAVAPSVADAHTDLDYTVPADGEQTAEPVAEITVAFDDPVTLVGTGFEVLTPAGDVVVPSVFSEDGAVYFLEVPEPLAGGVAAVRYEVSAADGHVLEGGVSFTVPAATALPADQAGTTAPAVVAPAPTASIAVGDDADGGGSGTGILIGVVAAVVLAGVAFLLLRSRMSTPG